MSKPPRPARAPASTSTSSNPDLLVIAQVLAPHGVKGEVKCRVITDFPKQRFKRGSTVLIRGQRHVVQAARIQADTVLLKLDDVADRGAAETLRGADVEVSEPIKLPQGQFYWREVIGLTVEHATTHELLGTVKDILETGANDVYIVQGPRGEILIPAIKDVIKEIAPEHGRILVEPLPGMIS